MEKNKLRNYLKCFRTSIIFLLLIALSLNRSLAACIPNIIVVNDVESWHYVIAPYFWMLSLNGDVTVRDRTAHISIPFNKIFEHLKMGGETHMEAIHGRWSLMLDPSYLKIAADANRQIINPELTTEVWLVDGGAYYQVLSTAPTTNYFASLELFGGARYLNVNNKLEFPRPDITVSANTSLFAPIIGARIKYDPSQYQKIHLWLLGNYGGFDVDNVRNTWEAATGIAYTIHRNIDLALAYRVIGIDFTKSRAAEDITLNGPIVGLVFSF